MSVAGVAGACILSGTGVSMLLLVVLFADPLTFTRDRPRATGPLASVRIMHGMTFLSVRKGCCRSIAVSFGSVAPSCFVSSGCGIGMGIISGGKGSVCGGALGGIFLCIFSDNRVRIKGEGFSRVIISGSGSASRGVNVVERGRKIC